MTDDVRPISLDEARAAKPRAAVAFAGLPVVGVGITRIGGGYGLKVNLGAEPAAGAAVPREVDGVPVRTEVVGPIGKR
ncbi:MAG: hypothetical protein ACRC7O_04200 [Fimbriiglobus sp.]